MLKERFYYGREYKLANIPCLISDRGEMLATGEPLQVKSLPRITICGIWDTNTNIMYFGVSRCSARDHFDKRIGRDIAYSRALNKPFKVVKIPPTLHVSDTFMSTAKLIEEEVMSMVYPINLNG